jgi:hypothetical protein
MASFNSAGAADVMSKDPTANAERVVTLIEIGRETERNAVKGILADSKVSMNRVAVRDALLKMLATRYKPAPQPRDDEAEKLRSAKTRAWLLYILPSVADGNVEVARVLRRALDQTKRTEQMGALLGARWATTVCIPELTADVLAELIRVGELVTSRED